MTDTIEALISAGVGLANCAYNIHQREGVNVFTLSSLKTAQEEWDKALGEHRHTTLSATDTTEALDAKGLERACREINCLASGCVHMAENGLNYCREHLAGIETLKHPAAPPQPAPSDAMVERLCAALAHAFEHDDSYGQVRDGKLVLDGQISVDAVRRALTTALAQTAPGTAQPERLPCDVQLPGVLLKQGVAFKTLMLALERKNLDNATTTFAAREQSAPHADLALRALNGMLDTYGPPGALRDTLEYPSEHPITLTRQAIAALSAVPRVEGWRSMDSAPKDGRMLRLLIQRGDVDRGAWASFADGLDPYETIGFNALADTLEDEWKFAGWDWCHDCFTDGAGEVVGWQPFETLPSAPTGGE